MARGDEPVHADDVRCVTVTAPQAALQPLIHHRPVTGLEGKFSLEYAVAAALLDERPGLASFEDPAVVRPEARALIERVRTVTGGNNGDDGLLVGSVAVEMTLDGGRVLSASVDVPSGAPGRPLSSADLQAKVTDCAGADADQVTALRWDAAADGLRRLLPG